MPNQPSRKNAWTNLRRHNVSPMSHRQEENRRSEKCLRYAGCSLGSHFGTTPKRYQHLGYNYLSAELLLSRTKLSVSRGEIREAIFILMFFQLVTHPEAPPNHVELNWRDQRELFLAQVIRRFVGFAFSSFNQINRYTLELLNVSR